MNQDKIFLEKEKADTEKNNKNAQQIQINSLYSVSILILFYILI